jgi:glutamate--cysteine ligase catalytic subunit
VSTRCELARYLDLIRRRADGTLWTGAKWLREFVRGHEEYKGDSVVSERVTYDLVKAVEEMTKKEGKTIDGRDGGVGWEMLTARERARGVDGK